MVRKWMSFLVCIGFFMGTVMAQDKPIVLFPNGAPGEKVKLVEEVDPSEKVGGEPIIRLKNVSEPTLTIFHAQIGRAHV